MSMSMTYIQLIQQCTLAIWGGGVTLNFYQLKLQRVKCEIKGENIFQLTESASMTGFAFYSHFTRCPFRRRFDTDINFRFLISPFYTFLISHFRNVALCILYVPYPLLFEG